MLPLAVDMMVGRHDLGSIGQNPACLIKVMIEEGIDLVSQTALDGIDKSFFCVVTIEYVEDNLGLLL